MNFPDALKYILSTAVGKVCRKEWDNTRKCYITRDGNRGINAVVEGGLTFAYIANGEDMTAEDWFIVE